MSKDMKPRHMKLGMFYWPCGHHIAAWRHPEGVPDSGSNLAHLIELAKLSEKGLFDMFFMADSVTFWRGDLDAMRRDSFGTWIEPFTLMCTLAQHTKHLGLVCTSTSTYDQPYMLARRFASLDIVSGGRAGWNLITSGNKAEADSFGFEEHPEKSTRYRRGREFANVVRGLWNSWQEGVFVRDKQTGQYLDTDRLRILQHEGEFLRVKGPLNVPYSPQGEPVLVQAGASEDGRQLAAETAEVVFGASQTLERAQEFYADVKARMVAFGRDPDSLKIMPGLSVSVAETREEADRKFEELQDLIDPKAGLQLLSQRMDYDFSDFDVNDPVPEIPVNEIGGSRAELMLDMARREKLTIRDLYRRIAGARGHCHISGTASEVADMMEEWVSEKGCDGFNIMPPLLPRGLAEFIDLVVPELQRRGIYRTEYEGTTLRKNLGLTRPGWSADHTGRKDAAE
ncbi:MAG: LLM class flavin-dependent oxidoreductase [Proteobacteria bacterium]|nr:LLM class flavin-dependent oxidoreductase [Pseudomonadota bacterium]